VCVWIPDEQHPKRTILCLKENTTNHTIWKGKAIHKRKGTRNSPKRGRKRASYCLLIDLSAEISSIFIIIIIIIIMNTRQEEILKMLQFFAACRSKRYNPTRPS
jgi:hypothetical protein